VLSRVEARPSSFFNSLSKIRLSSYITFDDDRHVLPLATQFLRSRRHLVRLEAELSLKLFKRA
jgi:hypothetical protein